MTLTTLETKVLTNILNSEFHDSESLEDRVNRWVWSFSATDEDRALAGALGSLVKKGLADVDGHDEDSSCCITNAGFEALSL